MIRGTVVEVMAGGGGDATGVCLGWSGQGAPGARAACSPVPAERLPRPLASLLALRGTGVPAGGRSGECGRHSAVPAHGGD